MATSMYILNSTFYMSFSLLLNYTLTSFSKFCVSFSTLDESLGFGKWQTKKEQAVILHGFHDFRTCTVIGDYEDSISDLKDWSESHEGKILVTKPSIYLTGASYAVYEGIGNAEKVSTFFL